MAAEPIHGCRTMPMGMKTPAKKKGQASPDCQGTLRALLGELRRLLRLPASEVRPSSKASRGAVKGRWVSLAYPD